MERLVVALLSFALFGCDSISGLGGGELSCNSEPSLLALNDAIKSELEIMVSEKVDQNPDSGSYDAAKLRTAISRVKVSLDKVRTTRDDPESSRKFCSARIIVKLPESVKDGVRATRAIAELGDINELARVNQVRRNGSSFETSFEFAVQPTDDGKDVVAEFENDEQIMPFLTEMFTSYALTDVIRNAQIKEKREVADSEREEKIAEQQLDQALGEQAFAELAEAKAENRLAVQRINAVWQSIPDAARAELLDIQRAWIKKTTAACKVEAAGTSEFANAREAVRLKCETRAQAERIRILSQYVEYDE